MSAVVSTGTAPASVHTNLPPAIIDIEALLRPISADTPSGTNIRHSQLFADIREARRADDTLPQGDWQHEPKVAQWSKVVELATSALASQSKDLQICAYLSEALVHLYGFVGLRDGLKTMRGLHENFWDTLFPELDGTNMVARGNALSWLDKTLEIPLKSLNLTKSGGGVEYNYLDWSDSTRFDFPENMDGLAADASERLTKLQAQAEEEGRTTGAEWRKAKGQTPRAFYEETYAILNQCWEEFQQLNQVVDGKFDKKQTPGLGTLKRTLDEIRTQVEKIVKEKRVLEPDPVENAPAGANSEPVAAGSANVSVGPLHSRQEALQRLAEVARYFEVTEPHSPVAYLVQRAIKWGQMPLEVWLADVIKDGNVLGQLKETLGIKMDGGS